ncbi:late competence development ComFB family protein [Phormidium sp. LEGE 05292]|uniref:late competence development ComFB family protein n=1 Tax=[Phormidium] sp. LEGE 05292 TaxID=767427 RepID=UPI001880847B|nr:late competence development ComFB family protein [Phormidium sp. LEGE 05292]MBE9226402.1 late competence development ComFB family protein [Phormidium sp. LEGE 05292]
MSASDFQPIIYRNALEPIVIQEVEQQLQKLSPNILQYINSAQIVAYALNRLPALYATSKEGWNAQQLRAKKQMKEQIVTAVRQGLAAVQRDPLKISTPLLVEEVKEEEKVEIKAEDEAQTQEKITAAAATRTFYQTEKRSFFIDGWDAG